jgi:hypothetical protein
MERVTKLFVVGWACAALAAQVWLLRGAWPGLWFLAIAAFTAAAALNAFNARGVSIVLLFAYIYPAVIRLSHGQYHIYFGVLWTAGLLGTITPDAVRSRWHIPPRWRGALVYWAVVIVVSASIGVVRELDFEPSVLMGSGAIQSSFGGGPGFMVSWLIYIGMGLLLGILWFDWLCGVALDFESSVALPLAVSAAALAAVSLYQMFVDFSFLNVNVFGGMGRASATMFDANLAGVAAALWVGPGVLWARRLIGLRAFVAAAFVVLLLLAVWASGSRTGVGMVLCTAAVIGIGLIEHRRTVVGHLRVKHAVTAVVAVVVIAVGAFNTNKAVVGPLERLRTGLPTLSSSSVRAFATELWNRNGYGAAAVGIIMESPWVGVGVGMFHPMVPRFGVTPGGAPLIADNAQNWYRHQVAEFGLLGSLGWIAWVVLFGPFVLRCRPEEAAGAWGVRASLVGFALLSCLGMPSQEPAITITFWTFSFWYVSLVGPPPAASPWPRTAGRIAAALIVVFSFGALVLAATRLRLPNRAVATRDYFSRGFYQIEPDGEGGERGWAGRHAVRVIDVPHPWVGLTVGVNHFDIAELPVHAKVWFAGELVIDERLTTTKPIVRYLRVPNGASRAVIETRADRVVRPTDHGGSDPRELGLLVRWKFLESILPPDERPR